MKTYLSAKIAALSIIVFYVSFSLFNYSIIEEDAFIFFRFAENLISGHGYVFNESGERIEACSSLTWLYLLVLFGKLGFAIPAASKVLGIILGCVSLMLIVRITRYYTSRGFWVFAPALLTSLSIPFLMWNQMGMETALYTSIFLFFILVCRERTLFYYWPLVAALLVLTRPEGFFIVVGVLPAFYFQRERKKTIVYSCVLFFCLLTTMLTARFLYFHDFMPSSFYHKVSPQQYREGFYYIHMFFRDYYLYYFFIPLLALTGKRWNWQEERTLLFWFIIVYLTWVVLAGKEFSKPFYRPLVPVIPLIYIYTVTGVERALRASGLKGSILGYSYLVLFALATLVFSRNYWQLHLPIANPVIENVKHFGSHFSFSELYRDRSTQPLKSRQVLIGEFIRRNYDKGSTFVYDQMGAVPYRAGSDYFFIDTLGLTDKTIGYYYFHQKTSGNRLLRLYERGTRFCVRTFFPDTRFVDSREEIIDYIFGNNPDVILMWEYILNFKDNLSQSLVSDERFANGYDLKYLMYGTLFFEKRGLIQKPLDIPPGLSVTPSENIRSVLKKDHPLLQSTVLVP